MLALTYVAHTYSWTDLIAHVFMSVAWILEDFYWFGGVAAVTFTVTG
jgi:hypothetical protein